MATNEATAIDVLARNVSSTVQMLESIDVFLAQLEAGRHPTREQVRQVRAAVAKAITLGRRQANELRPR